jgi:hypothetical protein
MAVTDFVAGPARVPGPPELLPGRPDAVIDLQTDAGAALAGAQWRYAAARIEEIDFVALGGPGSADPLGPGDVPNRTYDVLPHAEPAGFDDSGWERLAPADTLRRLGNGRFSFAWYRLAVTIPERVGDLDPTGSTVVFEIVVDDYAEVWVDGPMPLALGASGGQVVSGFNAPNRVVLTRDARPGDRFQLAVLGINGPISSAPRNYIWIRSATLDFHARPPGPEHVELSVERDDARLDAVVPPDTVLERVAGGFEFTEGPLWSPDGALLFSSPNTNTIYRLDPQAGEVTVFRTKSGYAGVDIGRYHQPGSNGLALSPAGLLAICQHGNRRVIEVNPHGDVTVLADRFRRPAAQQPQRPRLPLRWHALLHRPAVRAARRVRRPGEGARHQWRVPRPRWRVDARDGRARGAERDRAVARRALPLRRQLGSRAQGRPGRQPARLRAGRHLGPLARRRAARPARPAGGPAQPRVGRRRRPHALHHRPDQASTG